jgi:hypothetical protein
MTPLTGAASSAVGEAVRAVSPMESIIWALSAKDCEPRRNGDGYMARCPLHVPRGPMLHVSEKTGGIEVPCEAGCDRFEILSQLGCVHLAAPERAVLGARAGRESTEETTRRTAAEQERRRRLRDEKKVQTQDEAEHRVHADAVLAVRSVGARLLDDLVGFLSRYVAFPSAQACDAVALWAMHTHALDAFDCTPRLVVLSPEKGSGKSRLLETLQLVVANPCYTPSISSSALYRLVQAQQPTLLLDEADTYLGPHVANQHEALRGVVDSGHRRGVPVFRCDTAGTGKVEKFDPFAALALAGLGRLPATILDRAVIIRMKKRSPDEFVESFRYRKAKAHADPIRDGLSAWTESALERLGDAEPDMPSGLTDRAADLWEPLLAIADEAGGDWPSTARTAAVKLIGGSSDDTTSRGVALLADIRHIFDIKGVDRICSAALVAALVAMEDRPWGDLRGQPLDKRRLATELRRYDGIRSKDHRFPDEPGTRKGYLRSDFTDAWSRYLAESPTRATRATRATDLTSHVADVADVADGGGQ